MDSGGVTNVLPCDCHLIMTAADEADNNSKTTSVATVWFYSVDPLKKS